MRVNSLRGLLALVAASYTIRASNLTTEVPHEEGEALIPPNSLQFWVYVFISTFLSCLAGVASGLTVGFMAISKSQMELWSKSDNEYERKVSKPILDILNNHHFLLSTLLLANALALQALPIFLDKIVPSYLAIFISTSAVVIFGEVIPQAYCTGNHKVSIAYFFAPFVRFLQCIFYPFVKPIVYILDKFIQHDEGQIQLTHEKIKTVLLLHNKKQFGFRNEQIEILQNCLDLRGVIINQVMIPLDSVFMLSENAEVNEYFIDSLIKCNFSKIPIYSNVKSNVVGFIKVKNLLSIDMTKKGTTLKEAKVINPAVQIKQNSTLLDAIDILKTKKINFAIVLNDGGQFKGIITLKQIFQKIVLKEFKDDDIQAHIQLTKTARIDAVKESAEQD